MGAEVVSTKLKDFNSFNLLYIGTFNNRNLDQVITGFNQFYNEFKDQIDISFTIAGFGTKDVESKIKNLILEYQLKHVIKLTGKLILNKEKNCLIHTISEYHIFQKQIITTFNLLLKQWNIYWQACL